METRAKVGLVAVALVIVYIVWGSTYLAIRVVVEEMPPMTGMGSRFLLAGCCSAGCSRCAGSTSGSPARSWPERPSSG